MKRSLFFPLLALFALSACSYLPEDELVFEGDIDYRETTEYIQLSSTTQSFDRAMIFYPGGLVDPHGYVSVMEQIAAEGITVIILKVGANLAIVETGKALKVQDEFPEFTSWYVAGHSLGGIAAVSAISKERDAFDGLILMGTYPNPGNSIEDWERNVLSLYAENDNLATVNEVESGGEVLPPPERIEELSDFDSLQVDFPVTCYYLIEGGNHAQFGDYGAQEGDGEATITLESQHALVIEAITKFIDWNESQ